MVNNLISEYFELVEKNRLYSGKKYLKFKINQIFSGVDFQGKSVLDIGGGKGLFSIYAACMGAGKVVCLEPESSGSTAGSSSVFNDLNKSLDLHNTKLISQTFQEYDPGEEKFDIILLHNSINHLSEKACIGLQNDPACRETYESLFSKLNTLCDIGALLIVCDCSRKNFFNDLNLKNPFAKTIEWEKHQSPSVWRSLLEESGFSFVSLAWTVPNYFGEFGKWLYGNRIGTYFISSTFCLKMLKKR